eukprot:CAMPEP_0113532014 /NCGR_PEP_ID=MMETSP0015_2-20120614/3814_1 /TAXON_ID=2838 /ORGANISM="Odontella" /LENGTH=456 /DNA_ID=CAMNT_0000430909 /DNA_START=6 /DNA_END=1377 /DNA_ORIENTATION=- /assembly_acc=CAM_ASM_000160
MASVSPPPPRSADETTSSSGSQQQTQSLLDMQGRRYTRTTKVHKSPFSSNAMSRLSAAAILAVSCLFSLSLPRHALAASSADTAPAVASGGQISQIAKDEQRRTGVAPSLPEVLPAIRPGDGGQISGPGADVINISTTSSEQVRPSPVASPVDKDEKDHSAQIITNDETEEEEWRRALPPLLRRRRGTLHRMVIPPNAGDDGGCELYLLGTSHVSRDSCDDARLLVEHVRPHCLFVELCPQRIALLSDEAEAPPPSPGGGGSASSSGGSGVAAQAREMQARNPGMTRTSALSAALLTKIQGDYATKLGVTIGGEFRESYKVACRQQKEFESAMWKRRYEAQVHPQGSLAGDAALDRNGCVVVLGDRPVRLTLVRAWESLSLLGKFRLVLGLLWSSIRQPSEKELREWMDSIMNDPGNDLLSKSIEELGKHFPTIGEVIIHERDRYMAAKLLQLQGY